VPITYLTKTAFVSLFAYLLLACVPSAGSNSLEDSLFRDFPTAKLGKKVVLT